METKSFEDSIPIDLNLVEDVVDAWNPLDFLEEKQVKFTGSPQALRAMRQELSPEFVDPNEPILGYEVGDDRVDLCRNRNLLVLELMIQEQIVRMKTSKEDTFISTWLWNFCEVTSLIPCAPEDSFDYARKNNDLSHLGFVDCPPIRVIIDCMKGDRSHSSTVTGKAALLFPKMNPRSEYRATMHLASYLQDGMLRTSRAPEPKYLPRILGGTNVPALYDNYRNIYLYAKGYRGSGYSRLYGTATAEARTALSRLEADSPYSLLICDKLRQKQEYFYATYDEEVMVPPSQEKGRVIHELPPPLYLAAASSNRIRATEGRLIRARQLLTEKDAEVEIDRTNRINQVLFGIKPVKEALTYMKQAKLAARKKYDMALNANVAYMRLLNREAHGSETKDLRNDGFLTSFSGQRDFTLQDAKWISEGCRSEHHTTDDLYIPSNIYVRKEVSNEESFRVGGIPLKTVHRTGVRERTTTNVVGLYEIGPGMLEWAEKTTEHLIKESEVIRPIPYSTLVNVYAKDREWVQDDSLIIAKCLEDHKSKPPGSPLYLVSSDRKLARRLCNSIQERVFRVEPEVLIRRYPLKQYNSSTVFTVNEVERVVAASHGDGHVRPSVVHVDTGSLSSAASRMAILDDTKMVYIKSNIRCRYLDDGCRETTFTLKESVKVDTYEIFAPTGALSHSRTTYSTGYKVASG